MTTTINHLDHTRHHAGAMDDTAPPDPEVPERSAGRRQFSAKYKAKILAEYDALAPICPGSAAAPRGPVLLVDRRPGAASATQGPRRPWPDRPDARRPIRVIVRSPGSKKEVDRLATSSTSPDGSSRSRENFPRCWSNSPRTAQRRTARQR